MPAINMILIVIDNCDRKLYC